MKVMRIIDSAGATGVAAAEAAIPEPGAGEVRIRVRAAGITPPELAWYPTTHTRNGGQRSGAIPGHEFSGVIDAAGQGVDPGMIGGEGYGMNDWFGEGASAEYCLTMLSSVAEKPKRLTHAEAASVPISALTAWQGLYGRARLRSGERILIHGGAGGVGIYAVQLARRAGAHVIGTGSPRNFDLLRRLGADEVIDYHGGRFEDHARDLDVIFDTVGGETLARSVGLAQGRRADGDDRLRERRLDRCTRQECVCARRAES